MTFPCSCKSACEGVWWSKDLELYSSCQHSPLAHKHPPRKMQQRLIFREWEPKVLLISDRHSGWERGRLQRDLHVPVKGAAAKIVVAEGPRAEGGCSLPQYVVDKQTSAALHGGEKKKRKKELFGNSDCCRCFETLMGPIGDPPSSQPKSLGAWRQGLSPAPAKGIAEGCSGAAARPTGAPCLINSPALLGRNYTVPKRWI